MSQENVEVVQAAWAAWERDGLAGLTEYWADGIDWRAIGGRWRGKHAGRAYLPELLASFDELKPELLEFIDAGDQRVITVLRYSGREKQTGWRFCPNTSQSSTKSGTGRWSPVASTPPAKKPSKPPGWRSRRCRRRT
jgi:ketosteroid isomerase-like protein